MVNNSGGFLIFPSPIPLAAGVMFESVDVGADHHCAISTEKDAYCWGNNGDGQLGTGSTTASEFPVDKAGITTPTVTVAPTTSVSMPKERSLSGIDGLHDVRAASGASRLYRLVLLPHRHIHPSGIDGAHGDLHAVVNHSLPGF